jgi:hypothetical protein
MDRPKRIVEAFLNSSEGYFHNKRIIEDNLKKENSGLPSDGKHNKVDYTDIRDISKLDLDCILMYALNIIEKGLYKIMPSTALHAALQISIHTLNNGQYQSKVDATSYDTLYKILTLKAMERGL